MPLTQKYRSAATRESRGDQSPHDESAQRTCANLYRDGQAAAAAEPKLSPAPTPGSHERRTQEPKKAPELELELILSYYDGHK